MILVIGAISRISSRVVRPTEGLSVCGGKPRSRVTTGGWCFLTWSIADGWWERRGIRGILRQRTELGDLSNLLSFLYYFSLVTHLKYWSISHALDQGVLDCQLAGSGITCCLLSYAEMQLQRIMTSQLLTANLASCTELGSESIKRNFRDKKGLNNCLDVGG